MTKVVTLRSYEIEKNDMEITATEIRAIQEQFNMSRACLHFVCISHLEH